MGRVLNYYIITKVAHDKWTVTGKLDEEGSLIPRDEPISYGYQDFGTYKTEAEARQKAHDEQAWVDAHPNWYIEKKMKRAHYWRRLAQIALNNYKLTKSQVEYNECKACLRRAHYIEWMMVESFMWPEQTPEQLLTAVGKRVKKYRRNKDYWYAIEREARKGGPNGSPAEDLPI